MTPYYSDDAVTIYHGDCLEMLGGVGLVDLVVTSPPYNLNGDGNASGGTYFANLATGYATHTDDMPHTEYVAWQREVTPNAQTTPALAEAGTGVVCARGMAVRWRTRRRTARQAAT